MRHVFTTGVPKSDRTGTGTVSVFGYQMRFDLARGLPARDDEEGALPVRGQGAPLVPPRRRERPLAAGAGRHDLGRVGGRGAATSARSTASSGAAGRPPTAAHIDQIAEAVRLIREEPDSRRIVVSAWNVADLPEMALMPCHAFFQFYVADGRLSCQLYQRSADVFLGVPFNIASYALLTHMLAQQCDLEVGDFVWTGGDCHIYDNHREQVETQLARDAVPVPVAPPAPSARRRSSSTSSRTSRSSATSITRRSGRRVAVLKVSLVAAVARGGVIGRGRRAPLAPPRGHGALPGAHDGSSGRDGATDLGFAAGSLPAASRPAQRRRHAQRDVGG